MVDAQGAWITPGIFDMVRDALSFLLLVLHENMGGKAQTTRRAVPYRSLASPEQHSHLGVDAQPSLSATDDTNSRAGPIQPQLRTIDAINAHDLAYKRTVAGGVTTTLVLPGSANNIGGGFF